MEEDEKDEGYDALVNGIHLDFCLSVNLDPTSLRKLLNPPPNKCHYCGKEFKTDEYCYARGPSEDGKPGYVWCNKCHNERVENKKS
jgi:hypothetical protein